MTFSGILQNLQDRLGPLRAQLFPRVVLLELSDEALKGQLLRGDHPEPVSLEAPLPPLTCRAGLPLEPEPLGDMIGDLLVRDQLLDAHVMAALPPEAVEVRLIAWPGGSSPDNPLDTLRRLNPDLGLPYGLTEASIDLIDVPGPEALSLLAITPRRLVEGWIEVFNFAGAQLERLAPAQSCQLAALGGVLASSADEELVLLISSTPERQRLMLLRQGLPRFEREIPGDGGSLAAEVDRCLRFYRRQDPAVASVRALLADPLSERELTELEATLGVAAELLDHGAYGSLVLQGLAIHDLMP